MSYESEMMKLCAEKNVRIESKFLGYKREEPAKQGERGWEFNEYRVTLKLGRRKIQTTYRMGMAHTSEPDAAGVLYSLVSDARAGEQSFEDFCSDFGYDPDSRKAEKIWKACKALGPRVRRFLGEDFETFANAEH